MAGQFDRLYIGLGGKLDGIIGQVDHDLDKPVGIDLDSGLSRILIAGQL